MRRLKVLTWHTRGSYLHYLSHALHDVYVLTKTGEPARRTVRARFSIGLSGSEPDAARPHVTGLGSAGRSKHETE